MKSCYLKLQYTQQKHNLKKFLRLIRKQVDPRKKFQSGGNRVPGCPVGLLRSPGAPADAPHTWRTSPAYVAQESALAFAW